MTKRIAGIDYSLTSPAICVWKSTDDDGFFNFDDCDLYYLEKPRRRGSTPSGILNLHVDPYPEWETEEERHELLSTWAMEIVNGAQVFIEGYAFATSGKSYVRSVAENTGLLKHKMHKIKQPFTSVPPSVIKKYATGKGNANEKKGDAQRGQIDPVFARVPIDDVDDDRVSGQRVVQRTAECGGQRPPQWNDPRQQRDRQSEHHRRHGHRREAQIILRRH